MMPSGLIFAIGLLAQIMFAGRMLVQWFLSEKQKEVVSPKLFWRISLVASMMMCAYGWLRSDAAIIVGQLITYFIYIRNLQHKNDWQTYWIGLRIFIISIPLLAFAYILTQNVNWESKFISDNATWLIILGLAGQILFTFRFIIQFYFSEKRKLSVLPPQFWIISLLGSILIFIYGIYRVDYVLLIGHGGGMLAYIRNIMIGRKAVANA
jgi:lipid-A-disaccharide synthase-like uncharacterized protein